MKLAHKQLKGQTQTHTYCTPEHTACVAYYDAYTRQMNMLNDKLLKQINAHKPAGKPCNSACVCSHTKANKRSIKANKTNRHA